MEMEWIATPTYLIGGGVASQGSGSVTGVVLISRSNGVMKSLGDGGCTMPVVGPSIPKLPLLNDCAGQGNCDAFVTHLAWEPTSQRLLVAYYYVKGKSGAEKWGEGLAAYTLGAGAGRSWILNPYVGAFGVVGRHASIVDIGGLPGAFLVSGRFQLDGGTQEYQATRRLLVDSGSGGVLRRWGLDGERDLADGHVIDPGNGCTNRDAVPHADPARVGDTLYAWTDGQLCRDRIVAGAFTAERIPGLADGRAWPPRAIDSVRGPGRDGLPAGLGLGGRPDPRNGHELEPGPGNEPQCLAAERGGLGRRRDRRRRLPIPPWGRHARGGGPRPDACTNRGLLVALPGTAVHEPGRGGAQARGRRPVRGGTDILVDGRSLVGLDPSTGGGQLDAARRPAVQTSGPSSSARMGRSGSAAGRSRRRPPPRSATTPRAEAGWQPVATPAFGCLDVPDLGGRSMSGPNCLDPLHRTQVTGIHVEPDGTVYIGGAFGALDGQSRRGLARIAADGTVDAWNPDLVGSLGMDLDLNTTAIPMSFAVLGDNVVVGGDFQWVRDYDMGGSTNRPVPLLVYSATTGALLRPSGDGLESWFDIAGWNPVGYELAATDGGLVAALGEPGMGIFDATTLELDLTSSGPYFDPNWWSPIVGNEVLALATLPEPAPAQAARTGATAAASVPLVLGGSIRRWQNRVAGNVVRTTVAPDVTPPSVSGIRLTPRAGGAITGGIPSRVTWTAADPHGSGAGAFDVQISAAGGAWRPVVTGTRRRLADLTVVPGRDYRFRVRAHDNAGNVGAWSTSPILRTTVAQQGAPGTSYSGGWLTSRSPKYLGGSVRHRSAASATASYRTTARSIAFVTTYASLRGKARIYVDGRLKATVDLRSATARYRTVAFARSWPTAGIHTIKIVVVGTLGRPRVDVDGWVVVH